VQPTLTQLVLHLCKKKPDDPIPHMMQFLEDQQGTGKPEISPEERIELEMLRTEYASLKTKAEGLGKSAQETRAIHDEKKSLVDPNMKSKLLEAKCRDHSSSDSEGEEDVGSLPIAMGTNPKPQARSSVSAEVFGRYNKKEEFVPKVVAKSQEVKDKLKALLSGNFMFAALGEQELNIVLDAMEECKVQKDQEVIK